MKRFRVPFVASLSLIASAPLHAVDGTYIADANSNWSVGTSWQDGVIADGADFTANFTNDITADRTVTINGNRTIGNLVFDDAGASPDSAWTLSRSGSNVLTLSTTTGTPVITSNVQANITGIVSATDVRIAGTGVVFFSGGSTVQPITGTITVAGGATLQSNNNNSFNSGTTSLVFEDGAGITPRSGSRNWANPVKILGTFNYNVITNITTTLSGPVDLDNGVRTVTSPLTANHAGFSGNISNGGLIKAGDGTIDITGGSTYEGGTTISAGRLVANNTVGSAFGTGTVTVDAGGMVCGNGSFTGAVNVSGVLAPGIISPGQVAQPSQIGVLATGGATFNDASTYSYQVNSVALNGDLLNVDGDLTIGTGVNLTLAQTAAGTLAAGAKLTLISYGGAWNGGTFAGRADDSTFTLGANQWTINYNDTTGGTNGGGGAFDNYVTLTVVVPPSSPYDSWAAAKLLTAGNNAPANDPDFDGLANGGEFAFDGEPLSGAATGKVVSKIASVDSQQVLTITLPVRSTAGTFTGDDSLTVTVDGVKYVVEGTTDMDTWNLNIDEVTGPDAAAIQTDLPVLSPGWTYRTFRAPGTVTPASSQFLRASATTNL